FFYFTSSDCNLSPCSSIWWLRCSSSSASRSFSPSISHSCRMSSSSLPSNPPSVDVTWPSSILVVSMALIIWLRCNVLAASSLLLDGSSPMLRSLDDNLSIAGVNSSSLLEYLQSSMVSISASNCKIWLFEANCNIDFSFPLDVSSSLAILFSTLLTPNSSLIFSASLTTIRSEISCNCALFFSIVFDSFASISRRSSTESPNNIAFVMSVILPPKSSDIEPTAGSNSSPSADTVL